MTTKTRPSSASSKLHYWPGITDRNPNDNDRQHIQKISEAIEDRVRPDNFWNSNSKLPIDAAYMVMRRVSEAANIPVIPYGKSTYNRFQTLHTTPASILLKSVTWREFFEKKNIGNSTGSNSGLSGSASSTHPLNKLNATKKSKSSSDLHNTSSTPYSSSNISYSTSSSSSNSIEKNNEIVRDSFYLLCYRIELLWKELKIPTSEQFYYRKTLFKKIEKEYELYSKKSSGGASNPILSLSLCSELASYFTQLQQHRDDTKEVIILIKRREEALTRFIDVIHAITRKFNRISSSSNSTSSSISSSFSINSSSIFWQEELLLTLLDLRKCTINVCQSIQKWRKLMWRPHGFFYQNENYLLKIKNDLILLLDSNIIKKILFSIISNINIINYGIFFLSPNEIIDKKITEKDIQELFSPSINNNNLPSTIQNILKLFDTKLSSPTSPMEPSIILKETVGELSELWINEKDLEESYKLISKESKLNEALEIERESLQSKGAFIPFLRLNNHKINENKKNDQKNENLNDDNIQKSNEINKKLNENYNNNNDDVDDVDDVDADDKKSSKRSSILSYLDPDLPAQSTYEHDYISPQLSSMKNVSPIKNELEKIEKEDENINDENNNENNKDNNLFELDDSLLNYDNDFVKDE